MALLVACGSAVLASDGQRHPLVGTTVPAVTLPGLEGDELSLTLPGRVLLVNFRGASCPPCEAEMHDRQRLHERYGLDRFTVLGMNIDEPAERVVASVARRGLTVPVLPFSDANVRPWFHLVGLPLVWRVAPDGTGRAVRLGPLPIAPVAAQIEGLRAATLYLSPRSP